MLDDVEAGPAPSFCRTQMVSMEAKSSGACQPSLWRGLVIVIDSGVFERRAGNKECFPDCDWIRYLGGSLMISRGKKTAS